MMHPVSLASRRFYELLSAAKALLLSFAMLSKFHHTLNNPKVHG